MWILHSLDGANGELCIVIVHFEMLRSDIRHVQSIIRTCACRRHKEDSRSAGCPNLYANPPQRENSETGQ